MFNFFRRQSDGASDKRHLRELLNRRHGVSVGCSEYLTWAVSSVPIHLNASELINGFIMFKTKTSDGKKVKRDRFLHGVGKSLNGIILLNLFCSRLLNASSLPHGTIAFCPFVTFSPRSSMWNSLPSICLHATFGQLRSIAPISNRQKFIFIEFRLSDNLCRIRRILKHLKVQCVRLRVLSTNAINERTVTRRRGKSKK